MTLSWGMLPLLTDVSLPTGVTERQPMQEDAISSTTSQAMAYDLWDVLLSKPRLPAASADGILPPLSACFKHPLCLGTAFSSPESLCYCRTHKSACLAEIL